LAVSLTRNLPFARDCSLSSSPVARLYRSADNPHSRDPVKTHATWFSFVAGDDDPRPRQWKAAIILQVRATMPIMNLADRAYDLKGCRRRCKISRTGPESESGEMWPLHSQPAMGMGIDRRRCVAVEHAGRRLIAALDSDAAAAPPAAAPALAKPSPLLLEVVAGCHARAVSGSGPSDQAGSETCRNWPFFRQQSCARMISRGRFRPAKNGR